MVASSIVKIKQKKTAVFSHYPFGDGWCVGKSKLSSRQSTIAKVFCSRQSIYLCNDIFANLSKNKWHP